MRNLHRLYREETRKAFEAITDRMAVLTNRLEVIYNGALHRASLGETGARSEAIVICRELYEVSLNDATLAVDASISVKKRLAAQYGPDKFNVRSR